MVVVLGSSTHLNSEEAQIAPPSYKLKSKSPSRAMHLSKDLASRRCRWIEDSLTIHCDGNVSCGLDDPHAHRSFGNIHTDSIENIFANSEFSIIADNLASGWVCSDCSLYEIGDRVENKQPRPRLPTTLIIEPTVTCNLRCPNKACEPNNTPGTITRDASSMALNDFLLIINQVSSTLSKVYFFNYGDPFINRQAELMLLELRGLCPNVQIITSTNAIPLSNPERAKKVIKAEPDFIVVTLSGMTQESYARYHVGGKLDAALKGLKNLADAKGALGLERPHITWRYLLFRWNDLEEEILQAIDFSKKIGVSFSLYLTHIPENSASFRLSPGSPLHKKFQKFIDVTHDYNCEAPNESGLFSEEDHPKVGVVRWSSPHSLFEVSNTWGWLDFEISTYNPANRDGVDFIKITTPWGKIFSESLSKGVWRHIRITCPLAYMCKSSIILELETSSYWYPAEYGSADLRCLGFLLRNRPKNPNLRVLNKIFNRTFNRVQISTLNNFPSSVKSTYGRFFT